MLLAESKIMAKLVALILQGVECLILDLPPRAGTTHELENIVGGNIKVCNPAEMEVSFLLGVILPIFDKGDLEVLVALVERCVINDPKTVRYLAVFVFEHELDNLVVLCCLVNMLKKKFVITLFHAQNIVHVMLLQVFDMRGIRGQGILVDDKLQVRMILAQFAQHSADGIAFAVHFGGTILLSDNFRAQRNNLLEMGGGQ